MPAGRELRPPTPPPFLSALHGPVFPSLPPWKPRPVSVFSRVNSRRRSQPPESTSTAYRTLARPSSPWANAPRRISFCAFARRGTAALPARVTNCFLNQTHPPNARKGTCGIPYHPNNILSLATLQQSRCTRGTGARCRLKPFDLIRGEGPGGVPSLPTMIRGRCFSPALAHAEVKVRGANKPSAPMAPIEIPTRPQDIAFWPHDPTLRPADSNRTRALASFARRHARLAMPPNPRSIGAEAPFKPEDAGPCPTLTVFLEPSTWEIPSSRFKSFTIATPLPRTSKAHWRIRIRAKNQELVRLGETTPAVDCRPGRAAPAVSPYRLMCATPLANSYRADLRGCSEHPISVGAHNLRRALGAIGNIIDRSTTCPSATSSVL